ncbi:MAG TPA: PQQ-dependent sugar dehydrogenase [Myxococcaceae bacterium]|nr:PQQ-dependent sugar dehydrogenase [Myxococcaceae bacterium]
MRTSVLLALVAVAPAAAQTLSPGGPASTFQIGTYVSGLNQPTDFRFLPDGRVVMTEKGGAVKIRRTDGSVVTAGSFNVDSSSEKGLLGVEVDPRFATNTFLYFYASDGPSTANKHRVLRVALNPDNTLQCTGSCSTSAGVLVLLQNLQGPANHDGGGLAIGPDGKLYVGVGDTGSNSGLPPGGTITNYIGTCLTTANGKVLRINLDGSIPSDNPLAAPGTKVPACDGSPGSAPDPGNVTGSPRTEIWSWGFRNPFRFGFDPQTGRLWVGDVGEVSYEEVNLVTKGQHYGWPWREGTYGYPVTTCDNLGANGGGADCVDPSYFCEHNGALGNNDGDCQSITGGLFVDSASFPAPYRGRYFFGDNANGNLWTLNPNANRDGFVSSPRADFGTGFGTVVRFLVGPDGNLYVAQLEGSILVVSARPGDGGTPDGGAPDAGPPDAGAPDAGPRGDAGQPLDAGPIPFGGGTPPGGLAGGAPFQGPDTCRLCHSSDSVDAGTPYMPWDSWGATMMASAIRDPLFQAALTVANQDVLGIGQWCLRCHSPISYVRGHGLPVDGSALDAVDRAGVSCEVCHRTRTDAGLIGNAQLTFEPSFTVYGPYASADSPAHNAAQDLVVSQSQLCGQCHEVRNPVIQRKGVPVAAPFPLDTTYSEWLQSAYSGGPQPKSCQSCHMVPEQGNLPVAKDGPLRSSPSRHAFVGGNVWGLDAVRAAAPGELAGLDAAFAANRAAAVANLQAAARVEILLPDGPITYDQEVQLKVRVYNLTGHKLPTGYADGRRVFLELRVAGQVVSGAYDGDAGQLLSDPQLAVFEAVHARADGGLDHLALHDTIVKDTRIEPLGFQPDENTMPVGISFLRDGDGGVLGAAEWTYRVHFPSTLDAGSAMVEARLFHQATTRAYVEALAEANLTDGRGDTLHGIWEATGRAAPVLMTTGQATAQLTAAGPDVTGGCTCQSTRGGAALLPALALLVGWAARRRSR